MITNQSAEKISWRERIHPLPRKIRVETESAPIPISQNERAPTIHPPKYLIRKVVAPYSQPTKFQWPAPIQTNPSQRKKSLWCDYHRDHGHETDWCQSLKFLIEKLIKAGHLKRYPGEVDLGVGVRAAHR